MFQLGLAEIIQADREREIAELVRQRRLLKPDTDGDDPSPDAAQARTSDPRTPQAQVPAAGS